MFVDTHCHLDFPDFDCDRDDVIKRAKREGIEYIVNVGSSIVSSRNSVSLSEKYDFIYASVGIHPHEADNVADKDLIELENLAKKPKVKAIGEVGLDYYRNLSSQKNQKALFEKSILLSKKLGLPLVIHNRDASNDILNILKKHLPVRAVIHCFSGDENFLDACLSLGFFISFTANITYKNASSVRKVVKLAPMDRIFIETDAPYLTPQIYRGKTKNEPAFVKFVAEELAKIKSQALEKIALITTDNAKKFFGL